MTSILELKEERLKKLEKLKEKGFDPFVAHSDRNTSIKDFLLDFERERDGKIVIAGRVMSSRGQGNLIFLIFLMALVRRTKIVKYKL
jgi:lysyl-tRNA synthetase class II